MASSLVNVFENIVNKVSDNLKDSLSTYDSNIKAVNYIYGHWVEVSQRLMDMGMNQEQRFYKFPAVILVEDIPVQNNNGQIASATIQLLIVAGTNPNFTSPERQKKVFEPILYPIYDDLLKCIATSGYFQQRDAMNIEHRRWDRKQLGKTDIYGNTGTYTGDFLDAIQLQDLKLTYYKQKC